MWCKNINSLHSASETQSKLSISRQLSHKLQLFISNSNMNHKLFDIPMGIYTTCKHSKCSLQRLLVIPNFFPSLRYSTIFVQCQTLFHSRHSLPTTFHCLPAHNPIASPSFSITWIFCGGSMHAASSYTLKLINPAHNLLTQNLFIAG